MRIAAPCLRASEAKVDFSERIEHAISDSELMIIK